MLAVLDFLSAVAPKVAPDATAGVAIVGTARFRERHAAAAHG
jgi:hypothetical protein